MFAGHERSRNEFVAGNAVFAHSYDKRGTPTFGTNAPHLHAIDGLSAAGGWIIAC
jgi:hypothetical protein